MKLKLNIFILITSLVILLYSCKTVEQYPSEKEYIYINKIDTLEKVDSIYIHDSISFYVKGDTIFIEKYKDKIKYKYIYKTQIDTVYKDKNIVEVKTIEKKDKVYEKVLKWLGFAFIIIIGYYIFKKVKKIKLW